MNTAGWGGGGGSHTAKGSGGGLTVDYTLLRNVRSATGPFENKSGTPLAELSGDSHKAATVASLSGGCH